VPTTTIAPWTFQLVPTRPLQMSDFPNDDDVDWEAEKKEIDELLQRPSPTMPRHTLAADLVSFSMTYNTVSNESNH
jgi:hypothetical protein